MEAFVRSNRFLHLLLVPLIIIMALPNLAYAQGPVIHAVLFFSNDCSHCHEVMEQQLPPLVQKYGKQLDIVGVDVNHAVGLQMYQAMLTKYNVPDERVGVPTLVVGSDVLVGSDEIPQKFPGIIEAGLAQGGIEFPDIPGLSDILAAQTESTTVQTSTTQNPVEQTAPPGTTSPVFLQKFMSDPVANSIAVIVLLAMIACVILVAYKFLLGSDSRLFHWPSWVIPVVALLGMGVAFYLSFVEITKTEAICGPVGNCNSVQESQYATLFGLIPVGALGLVGYASILAAWLFRQSGPKSWSKFLTLAIWIFAWFGILFTIYLTFLEPFVIGATCAWCITSAILMTIVFLAATGPAIESLKLQEDLSDEEDEFEEEDPDPSLPELR
jgi:uncharacterized membrane protein/thiol-disulfide isomerase/thioredoxin